MKKLHVHEVQLLEKFREIELQPQFQKSWDV